MSLSKRRGRIIGSGSGRVDRREKFHPVVVLTTAGSPSEAKKLSRVLLKEKAAACVNIIPRVDSEYWWEGKIARGKETLLLIKTQKSALKTLSKTLKKHHSYTLAELIALDVCWTDPSYLNWLRQNIESH